tara:strand:- start:232 stop:420 length:189 start_codon:yes stop_codon:yes gene_type:complete
LRKLKTTPSPYVSEIAVSTKLGLMLENEEWTSVEQLLESEPNIVVGNVEPGSLETPAHIIAR